MGSKYQWLISTVKNKNLKIDEEAVILEILKSRTIVDIKSFLFPDPPRTIKLKDIGIKKNQFREFQKILEKNKHKKIIIYGDYDADGICATAIMWETLYALGYDSLPFIPNRFHDGYGINQKSVSKLIKRFPDIGLVITVDNGIVAYNAARYLKEKNIDFVITDHHQRGSTKPEAKLIIHSQKVSGAGLSWVIAKTLLGKMKFHSRLELAAIGTISDQIPLLGVNRSMVKYGLSALNKSRRKGLVELVKNSGIKMGELDVFGVGFMLAPRINASGRLDDAHQALRLLCTNKLEKASAIAESLGSINKKRQDVLEANLGVALRKAKKLIGRKTLVIEDGSFHEGVIGLVASKIADVFYRPTIIISKGLKISKASGRSIPGFNLINSIRECEKYIIDGGGHETAVGFSVRNNEIKKFKERFEEVAGKKLTERMLVKKLKIDFELSAVNINKNLLSKLKSLEPYGIGNPKPVFLSYGMKIAATRVIGKQNKHLKFKLEKEGYFFDAVFFNGIESDSSLSKDDVIDVCYYLEENTWNGITNVQLNIKDVRKQSGNQQK